jgi:hypothetical protein
MWKNKKKKQKGSHKVQIDRDSIGTLLTIQTANYMSLKIMHGGGPYLYLLLFFSFCFLAGLLLVQDLKRDKKKERKRKERSLESNGRKTMSVFDLETYLE